MLLEWAQFLDIAKFLLEHGKQVSIPQDAVYSPAMSSHTYISRLREGVETAGGNV